MKLKEEIIHLKSNAQSLTVDLPDAYDAQLLMYTETNRKIFNSLLKWLHLILNPKKDDSHLLLPSQKLMVLMRIRQNFPWDDLYSMQVFSGKYHAHYSS